MLKELKLDIPPELPYQTKDLFAFSFDFENLMKTIDYLHKYNLALFSQLQSFNTRMNAVEEIVPDVYKLKTDVENLEAKDKEHESLINENQSRIKEIDKKIKDLNDKIDINEYNIKKNKDSITEIEKKLDGINKSIDDNKNNQSNKSDIDTDKIKKFLNENVIGTSNKDIDTIKHNINNINDKIEEVKKDISSKNANIEKKISNILSQIDKDESNILRGKNQGEINLFKITLAEIEKDKKNFQAFMDDYNTEHIKMKDDITWLNEQVEENKNNHQIFLKAFNEELGNKKKFITFEDVKDINTNIDDLLIKIKQCCPKTDLENFKNVINTNFQKINGKLKELSERGGQFDFSREENVINDNDTNIDINKKNNKTIITNYNAGSSTNANDFKSRDKAHNININLNNKNITELVAEIIKSEIKNIDMSENGQYIELMNLYNKNMIELNKCNKTVSELKNIVLSNQSKNDFNKLQEDLSHFRDDFKIYKYKLIDLVQLVGHSDVNKTEEKEEKKTGEKSNKLSKEELFEKKLKQSEETIQGKLEFLTDFAEIMNNKLVSLEKKFKSMNKDIKDEIKILLKNDTYQVVEQFKLKLNSFTNKFENELKNKIDRIGLNSFETKLNSKLSFDLKDKLNRNDLKKNNFVINKKIDTLENKISKTLVDTIIDLQMDDAPLLMKQNNKNVGLCASCNRPFAENSMTMDSFNMSTSPNIIRRPNSKLKSVISLKKLPNIVQNINQK